MYKERNKTRGMGRGGIFRSISFVMLFLMLAGSLAGIGSLLFKNTSVLDEAGTGGSIVTAGITGSGNSADDPYVITTKQDLIDFANPSNAATYWRANSFAKLAADIDWGGQDAGNWTPIGNATTPYQGSFDGNKHAIKNLYCVLNGDVGIFGLIKGKVTIKNLGNVNGNFTCTSTTNYVSAGGIVGRVDSNSTVIITNCFNTGSAHRSNSNGYSGPGGILGSYSVTSTSIEVSSCFNTGSISTVGSYTGGIVGSSYWTAATNHSAVIKECFNAGKISATSSLASGIVNHMTQGVSGGGNDSIINCYNVGEISAPSAPSGITCRHVGTLSNCYNAGIALGAGLTSHSGYITTFANNYNNSDMTTSAGANGGTNLTKSQMTGSAAVTNMSGLGTIGTIGDGTGTTWVMTEGGYPQLRVFAESNSLAIRTYSEASVNPAGFTDPGYKKNENPVCNSNTTVEVPSIGNGT